MGERLKEGILLAPWIVTMASTLLVVIMGFTVSASTRTGGMETEIKHNSEDINRLYETKADESMVKALDQKVDMVYETLIRMEEKMDEYNKSQ